MINDEDSLIQYSNKIINVFIRKQLKFFPNDMRVINHFIVISRDLLCSVIIENNIPMTEMIPAQLYALFLEHDEKFKRFSEGVKNDIIKAGLR